MALDPKLIAQIIARPMDDAPRLVAADQLMEANDPRGDFIALQCTLARGGLSPSHRAELRRREHAHLSAHRAAWTANAPGVENVVLRRGFIDLVTGDARALVECADTLFTREPVARLTVTGDGEELAALARTEAFLRVSRLNIVGDLGGEGAHDLARALARRTSPLDALNVDGCGIGADGLTALAPALKGCRVLALTGNPIGDEGLARVATIASLEILYATATEITDDGLKALGKLAALRRLAVARNEEISRAGLAAIANSKKLRKLRWLEYTDSNDERQHIAVRAR